MKALGFSDFNKRLQRIDKAGDPLSQLNTSIDWEQFRPILEKARKKPKKSNAGAKGYDVILLFKMLILQSLYNLSDQALEFQVLDRYSFSRFLGLQVSSKVPDATTIWLFREDLTRAHVVDELFYRFNQHLNESGFRAQKGQIVDASIVKVPTQRNTREEQEHIKAGETPKDWNEPKKRQKDVEARWTKKNGKSFFGYKNHISVDVKYKMIRHFEVTSAEVHDSRVFEELLDDTNRSREVWADSAYRSEEQMARLKGLGYRERIQRKGTRKRKLSAWEQKGNRTRSRTRSRVEHVFGVQLQQAKTLTLRGVGKARAKTRIGLRNLAYNLKRFGVLIQTQGSSLPT
jgi:IS5 family transposase